MISINAVCMAGGILAASMLIPVAVCGQGPPAGAGAPSISNPKIGDRVRQVAEGRLRSAELEASVESENEKHIEATIVHMKQDFTRIQVLRNDIARKLVAHKPLDYDLISRQTAEINKRANEMNTYMMAHAPEDKQHNNSLDVASEEMIGSLVRLCKLIDGFTENPSLKNAGTVDAKEIEQAKVDKARAAKDLKEIIELSEKIKKKSDSLKGS
jgi:hypothetical protein